MPIMPSPGPVNNAEEQDETPDGFDRPSKTQRKKASHDLQDLGEALVALSDARLDQLPIDELLLDSIRAYRRTKTHEGRRRQMQFIGKLMRRTDSEPLREASPRRNWARRTTRWHCTKPSAGAPN